MGAICELSVEVLARIFEELDLDDAWTAREVCRYWHSVFAYVAYDSANSVYLRETRVAVQVICGITTATGKVPDRHIIPGELAFEATHGTMAKWSIQRGKKKHEFWPCGQWRKTVIGEALVDVRLEFSNLFISRREGDMTWLGEISLGKEVTLTGYAHRDGCKTSYSYPRDGKFKDFTVSIDTHAEVLCCRKSYDKHCITSLVIPKWQIYALLVHHIQIQRHFYEFQCRHYLRSSNFQKLLADAEVGQDVLSLGIF
jgi:hypothetical protein